MRRVREADHELANGCSNPHYQHRTERDSGSPARRRSAANRSEDSAVGWNLFAGRPRDGLLGSRDHIAICTLERVHVPRLLAALILIFAVFGTIIGIGAAVSGPATSWAGKLPEGIPRLQERLQF